jgi:hypothetical protein
MHRAIGLTVVLTACGQPSAPLQHSTTGQASSEPWGPVWSEPFVDAGGQYAIADGALYMLRKKYVVVDANYYPGIGGPSHLDVLDATSLRPQPLLTIDDSDPAFAASTSWIAVAMFDKKEVFGYRRGATTPSWRIPAPSMHRPELSIAGNLLVANLDDGRIAAFDVTDGARRWAYTIPNGWTITKVDARGRTAIVIALDSNTGKVPFALGGLVATCLDLATGFVLWQHRDDYATEATVDATRLAFAHDKQLVVVDRGSGVARTLALPLSLYHWHVALDGDVAYLGGYQEKEPMTGVSDPQTGELISVELATGHAKTLLRGRAYSEHVVGTGALFVLSRDAVVRALDKRSGTVVSEWGLGDSHMMATIGERLYTWDGHRVVAYGPTANGPARETATIRGSVVEASVCASHPVRAQLAGHTITAADESAVTRADGSFELRVRARGRLKLTIDDRRSDKVIQLDGSGAYTTTLEVGCAD